MTKERCFGGKPGQELYAAYHDNEWGIPSHDDRHLFEMLILEGAQAGLSWETVLKKREGYRRAFYNFDVAKIAAMSDEVLETLMHNPEIICNRLKIFAARRNAKVYLALQEEFGSFDKYLWAFVAWVQVINHPKTIADLQATSPISDALSKDLKKRGMTFVGSTIMYAFMQAVGMVRDHIASCPLYNKHS